MVGPNKRDRYRDDPWYEGTEQQDGEPFVQHVEEHLGQAVAAIYAAVASELAEETANEGLSFLM